MARRWILLLLALTLVREMFYLAVTPPFQGPDEPGHFEYVALIQRLGRVPLPRPDTEMDPALTRAINAAASAQRFALFHPGVNVRQLSEQEPPVLVSPREAGYQAPVYYQWLTPVYALVSGQDVLTQYYAVAGASSLLALITVLAAALAAGRLFPTDAFAQRALPLLVAFWPTQTYMMSRINNDNLATAVGAVAFYMVIRLLEHGLTLGTGAALAGLIGLALITKGTTLFLLPILGGAVILSVVNGWPPARRQAAWLGLTGVVVAGLGLGVAALLNPGLAAGVRQLVEWFPGNSRAEAWLASMLATLATGQTWQPERLAANQAEFSRIWRSFWALFGWGRVWLAPIWYGVAAAGVGLAGVGLLVGALRRGRRPWTVWRGQVFILFALAFGLAWVPLYARMIIEPFAVPWHGRSLLPALLPVSAWIVLGLSGWLPPAARALGVRGWLLGLLLLDTACLAGTIVPYFYQ